MIQNFVGLPPAFYSYYLAPDPSVSLAAAISKVSWEDLAMLPLGVAQEQGEWSIRQTAKPAKQLSHATDHVIPGRCLKRPIGFYHPGQLAGSRVVAGAGLRLRILPAQRGLNLLQKFS